MLNNFKALRKSAMVGVSAIALSSLATAAHAAEFVKNGGFSQNSIAGTYGSSFVNGNQGVTVTDWTISTSYTFLVSDGTSITANINESGNGPDPVFGTPIAGFNGNPLGLYTTGQSVASPTGSGWFIASDGAYGANAEISQTIQNLTIGTQYTLSFYQASGQQQGFTGDATAFFKVFLDNIELTPAPPVMNIPSASPVSPWAQITIPFTAASANPVLKFVADGAPSGQPPFALLTGVSITDNSNPVPEPLTILGSMTAVAFGVASKARSKQKNK